MILQNLTKIIFTIFLLTGCNGLGVDLTAERTIVIQKSPYLIIASGDLEMEDMVFINDMIVALQQAKFEEFCFNPIDVSINHKKEIVGGAVDDK